MILRNLDLLEIVGAGSRLTEDAESERRARKTQTMGFGSAEASDGFADALRGLITTNLARLRFGHELMLWVLSPALGPDRAHSAADMISAWEFNGDVRPNRPPDPRAPQSWLMIDAEDFVIDLLMQPLAVVSDVIGKMYQSWTEVMSSGASTFPALRVGDGVLAEIELFVIETLGAPFSPITAADAHFREGATTAIRRRQDATAEQVLSRDLGFIAVPAGAPFPWKENVDGLIDETSHVLVVHPASDDEPLYVDPFYGHAYHTSVLQNNLGIYLPARQGVVSPDVANHPISGSGRLAELPLPAPNYGWLSVPFRRVPRYRVESADEFALVLSGIRHEYAAAAADQPRLPLLLRGQTSEYLLPRPSEAREVLYEDREAREPALLASATRRATTAPAAQAFAGAVQAYLLGQHGELAEDEVTTFPTYTGDLIKTAFAQHYGLATDALDWTTDPLVAAWFALTDLRGDTPGRMVATPVPHDKEVVIYCLRPQGGHVSNIELFGLSAVRPSGQRGWVSTASSGLRTNRAARYLAAAIYMPGSVRNELGERLPSQSRLFPGPTRDALIQILKRLCDSAPASPISQQLRHDLYEL